MLNQSVEECSWTSSRHRQARWSAAVRETTAAWPHALHARCWVSHSTLLLKLVSVCSYAVVGLDSTSCVIRAIIVLVVQRAMIVADVAGEVPLIEASNPARLARRIAPKNPQLKSRISASLFHARVKQSYQPLQKPRHRASVRHAHPSNHSGVLRAPWE